MSGRLEGASIRDGDPLESVLSCVGSDGDGMFGHGGFDDECDEDVGILGGEMHQGDRGVRSWRVRWD